MISKKIFMFGILILLIGIISAVETSYCCEKLKNSDVMCQNAPLFQCDTGTNPVTSEPYKHVGTSCEATSYCKLATCINAQQGDCIENSPLSACNAIEGGVWKDQPASEIPQCKLGCCLLGDQAAFVTQTRCNKLAAIYGLEINFRQDIQSELECLTQANSAIEGACVFEKEGLTTCKRLNQKNCNEMKTNSENQNVMFYENYLCSAVALGTDCARSEKTTCVPNKDEVYFVDTCGNIANIYDSSKQDESLYWEKIITKEDICNEKTSEGSNSCGNCNYLLGSVCSEYKRGENSGNQPTYGNYYCKDLSCDYDENGDGKIDDKTEHFQHGESICLTTFPISIKDAIPDDTVTKNIKNEMETLGTTIIKYNSETGFIEGFGIEEGKHTANQYLIEDEVNPGLNEKLKIENLPGSRYYRMICSYGEMIAEPCADFRQEICIQSDINEEELNSQAIDLTDDIWSNAACRINRWKDCLTQVKKEDCEQIETRDCVWYKGEGFGKCVPIYAPGLNFWNDEAGESTAACALATDACSVTLERKFFTDYNVFNEYIKRNTCGGQSGESHDKKEVSGIISDWSKSRKEYAQLLGDCGMKYNYLGFIGSSKNGVTERKKGKGWN